MLAALALCGSASSIHAEGRASRGRVEEAREAVAALVGGRSRDVVFTSGASEANALALSLAWQRGAGSPALAQGFVSAVEHSSVLSRGRLPPAGGDELPVDGDGRLDIEATGARLTASGGAPFVSVMLANNETGVVQPLERLVPLVRAAGGVLHSDAAQAAGRLDLPSRLAGVDLVTLSSHKIGGPGGAGALVILSPELHMPEPMLRGGGQELGRRAGTENVAALAGFGAAAAAVRGELEGRRAHMLDLRDYLEAGLRAVTPDVVVFGETVERLANTTCFALPGMRAETALIALDLEGFALSSGSACSSGKVRSSHVLSAMAVPESCRAGALRLSTGPQTSRSDIDSFLSAWKRLSERLHATRPGSAVGGDLRSAEIGENRPPRRGGGVQPDPNVSSDLGAP